MYATNLTPCHLVTISLHAECIPQVRSRYDGLRKSRLDGFMAGFNVISLKLKEMYQMITLGGDAELELVDTLDPFSEVGGPQRWAQALACYGPVVAS